eukprot:jgi/Tetstr1/425522/TSEL_001533.t1
MQHRASPTLQMGSTTMDGRITPVQATYTAGQEIEIETTSTAFHKGYVVVRLCPNGANPTEACFAQHVLEWNPSIDFYNAAHPERLELHPRCNDRTTWYVDGRKVDCWDTHHSTRGGYLTRHEISASGLKLPDGLSSDHAVLQWVYYTDVGTGEKFWNCADIRIRPSGAPIDPVDPLTHPCPRHGRGWRLLLHLIHNSLRQWMDRRQLPLRHLLPQCPNPAPATPSPTPAPPSGGGQGACDASGKWPSYKCNGGTGACRHVSAFTCYEAPPPGYPTANGCYAGTMHCSEGDGRRKLSRKRHMML